MKLMTIIKKKIFCGCLAAIFAFNSFLPVSAMIRCHYVTFGEPYSDVGSAQYNKIKESLLMNNIIISSRLLSMCICLAISEPERYDIGVADLFDHLCFCHVAKHRYIGPYNKIYTAEKIDYFRYDDSYVKKILEIIYWLCAKTSTYIVIYPNHLNKADEDSVWKRVAKDFCYVHSDVFLKSEYSY